MQNQSVASNPSVSIAQQRIIEQANTAEYAAMHGITYDLACSVAWQKGSRWIEQAISGTLWFGAAS